MAAKKTAKKKVTRAPKRSRTTLDHDAFAAGVTKLTSLLTEALETAKAMGMRSLSAKDRGHSMGKLRRGEAQAITNLFDAIDEHPMIFSSLAPRNAADGAVDTGPARAALARTTALHPIAALLATLLQLAHDESTASGEDAKALSVPAYGIAKAVARASPSMTSAVAPALTFYSNVGRIRALRNTKAKNLAKRAAKKATKS